jgi:type IV pilus assembly protein PilF
VTGRSLILALVVALACSACVTDGVKEKKPEPSMQEASDANLRLGAAYLRQGDLELAISKLQKAVDLNPKSAQAHATLALAYERLGLAEDADDHYLRAIRLTSNDAVIDNMYGAYLCRNGKLEQAERYLLKAATNPRYRTPEAAYTNAGICAQRAEQLDRAEEYFRAALQINPRYVAALWQMAELSHLRDRDLQARAFLQRLSATAALPPNALWLGLRVERRLGDREAADRYAQRLKSEFPDSRETAQLLELERDGG